ncbi:hypothetical protein HOI71_01600, partial [Candidatus Poribacteria bacterium]|nr:hypothetical protein [Candidatus Poribacteria bacterium]
MAIVSRRAVRIGLALAALLASGLVAFLYLRSDAFLRHLTPLLEQQVSRVLGSPVHIRDFHTVGVAQKELTVEVMEPDGSSPILTIDSLILEYRRAPILRGELHISDVRARDVGIHVRRMPDDDLNISALVSAVSADDDGGAAPIEISVGSIDMQSVSVNVDQVIGDLLITIPALALSSEVSAPLPLSATRPFEARADAWTVTRGENAQTLDGITARGTVNADRVTVEEALLTAPDSRVSAHGVVVFTPSVDLTIDGVVNADVVRPLYPDVLRDAHGAVELDGLRLTGELDDPVVEGPWTFHDALWGQMLVAAGSGALRWQGGDASLRDIEISVFGGSVLASARADDLGTGALEVKATARDLDVSRVREAFASATSALDGVTGKLDGEFSVALRDEVLRSTGEWRLRSVAWDGNEIGDGDGTAAHTVDGERFDAQITLAGDAQMTLSGPLPGEALDVEISFVAADVGHVAKAFGQDARGGARGQGRITGTAERPVIEVEARWPEGAWRGFPVLNAVATLRWEDDTLRVLSATAESGDGVVSMSGTIHVQPDGSRPPVVDVTAEAHEFLLDPYVAVLSPGLPLSASSSGAVHVTGSLDALDGEATLRLSDATYASVPIGLSSVALNARAGEWTVPPFELTVGEIPLTTRATFDDQAYAFSAAFVEAAPISDVLALIADSSDAALQDAKGSVRVTAEGSGAFESPTAELRATVSDAEFRSARLGDSDLLVTYTDGAITGSGSLADGAYSLALTGEVTPDGAPFDASLTFADTDVLPLIRLVGQPAGKGLRSTTVGGEMRITGDLAKWREALASVALSSLTLRTPDYELTNVDPVRGSISASGIELSPIVMSGSDPAHPFDVEFSGLLDLHKPIAFDVEARTFDLEMVSDFIGLPGLAAGVGTYRLDMAGTAAAPIVNMSWHVPKATIALRDGAPRLEIENVRGEAEYRNRVVTLRRMGLRLGGRDLDVSGEIPMALSFVLVPLVEQLLDAPLRLTVSTQQDDLSWAPSLHPQLQGADGSASVTVDVSGSIRNPRVTGSARVDASRVALQFSNRPIENIVVTAIFASDESGRVLADVESRAQVGDGAVTGSGSFEYPLDLVDWRNALDLDNLRGHMDFGLDGLRMSRLVEFAGHAPPPLEVESSGSARVDVVGVDPLRWQGSVKLSDAALIGNDRLLPNQGPITLSYDGSTLRLDKCRFGMGYASLDLAGALHADGSWEGAAEAARFEVAMLGDFLKGPAYPHGLLTATATVGGSPAKPTLDANWLLEELRYNRFRLDTFKGSATYADGMLTLPQWDLESFGNHMTVAGAAPLVVEVGADGLVIERPDLPMSLTLNTEAFDISFASLLFPSVDEASGKALIDVSINGTSRKPYLVGRVQMPDAALTLAHNGMRLDSMVAYVDARQGRIDVDKFRFDVGAAHYEMVSTSLHVNGLDPTLLLTSMTVTDGSAEAWFPAPVGGENSVATSITGKVAASVDVAALRRDGLFESAETGSEMFERAVRLTSHVQGQAQLSALSVGWLGYNLSNPPETPVKLTFDEGVLNLERVELRQVQADGESRHADVRASGTWAIGGEMDVRVEGRLGAAFISDWLGEHVFTHPAQEAPSALGSLEYAVHVTGPDTRPRAAMSMNSTDLALGKLRLDSIAATASYAADVLTLDDCQLTASGSNATLRGSIPFHVSLYEAQARPRAADMQMQLNADLTNADVLPLLFPFIGRAAGSGEVHLSVRGRLDDPRYYNGAPGRPAIALRGLRLDVPANDVEFSGVEAALTADGDHFEIDRLDGVVNRGTFAVTQGTVGLTRGIPTDVDVAVTADDVTLTKRRLYRAMGDATVRMHGPLDRVQVDGDVTFSSLDYKRDWAELAREALQSKALIALREGARFQYPIVRGMVVNLRVRANEVAFDTGAG